MDAAEVKGRSLWADARTRFMRNKAAVVSLILLGLVGACALFGGLIAQWERDFGDFSLMGRNANLGVPSLETGHFFGTENSGRDLYGRVVQGTGISLMVGIVIVYAALLVPNMIIFESFISFLGLGVQEPDTSLGALINEGAGTMQYGTLWQIAFPLFFFVVTIFAFFFVGDGLRDALDPKDR